MNLGEWYLPKNFLKESSEEDLTNNSTTTTTTTFGGAIVEDVIHDTVVDRLIEECHKSSQDLTDDSEGEMSEQPIAFVPKLSQWEFMNLQPKKKKKRTKRRRFQYEDIFDDSDIPLLTNLEGHQSKPLLNSLQNENEDEKLVIEHLVEKLRSQYRLETEEDKENVMRTLREARQQIYEDPSIENDELATGAFSNQDFPPKLFSSKKIATQNRHLYGRNSRKEENSEPVGESNYELYEDTIHQCLLKTGLLELNKKGE